MGEKQKVFLFRFYKVTVSHLGISVWEWKLEFLIKIGAILIAYSWQEKLGSTGVVFITQKCLLTQICTHRIFIATENEFEKKLRNYVYFHYIKFTWKWFTLLCAACPDGVGVEGPGSPVLGAWVRHSWKFCLLFLQPSQWFWKLFDIYDKSLSATRMDFVFNTLTKNRFKKSFFFF